MQYLFILGALDIEMMYIKKVVKSAGHSYVEPQADGSRLHPGNAYRAEHLPLDIKSFPGQVVWVECALADESVPRSIVVDHHRPGDPGYDMGPESFWLGSSIGQVCALLGVRPTKDLLMAAASDHCLGAAYQGLCPGIDPVALSDWRIFNKCESNRLAPNTMRERLTRAFRVVRDLKPIRFGKYEFLDAMDINVPDLSEASAILGKPIMFSKDDLLEGRRKVGARNGSVEVIADWMSTAADVLKLEDVYGCPTRGYAGAYLPVQR